MELKSEISIKDFGIFQNMVDLMVKMLKDESINEEVRDKYRVLLWNIMIDHFTILCETCNEKLKDDSFTKDEMIEIIKGNIVVYCTECHKKLKINGGNL